MRKIFLALALVFAMAACTYNPFEPGGGNNGGGNGGNATKISFANLQVGQQSRYLYFVGSNYTDRTNIYSQYYRDTLIVSVLAKSGDSYIFQERMSSGSMRMDSSNYNDSMMVGRMGPMFMNQVLTYNVRVTGDSIIFYSTSGPLRSNFGFGNAWPSTQASGNVTMFALPAATFTNQYIRVAGWKPDFQNQQPMFTGYTTGLVVNGNTYDRLNVYVNNTNMQSGGASSFYIYSLTAGIVRVGLYGSWNNQGTGWDLL